MRLLFLVIFLSPFLFGATPSDMAKTSPAAQEQLDDSDELDDENPLEEEDPLDDDPLADDTDSEPSDEPAQASSSHFPKVKTDHTYRFALGHKDNTLKGFATGSDSDEEDKIAMVNAYVMKTKITYTEDTFFFFRAGITFLQEYDFLETRYTDSGDMIINEAYYNVDKGDYAYKVGAILLKNGPLDINSPSNVLNMSNSTALESFDFNNITKPFVGAHYSSLSENSTLSFALSLLKPETSGSEYTRYLEEVKQRDSGDTIDDYSELSTNAGLRYIHNFSAINIGLSAYYWFDKDTQINWIDSTNSTLPSTTSFSDSYSEKVTNVLFAGFDFDMNIGQSVLKGEFYYFQDKNQYSFYTNPNNENNFSTVETDMFSAALSLEKIWGDFFVMGVYSYKQLFDVDAGTNILNFENNPDNNTDVRNLELHQGTLLTRYAISDKLKMLFSYSQAFPVESVYSVLGFDYQLSSDEELGLKAVYIDTEEHVSTSSKFDSKQIYFDYKAHF